MCNSRKAYLVWSDTIKTMRKYNVGILEKRDNNYKFYYCGDIDKAMENGFRFLISFDDKEKVYESDVLFPIFEARLPHPSRKDLDRILTKYDLDEYDAFELLIRSGAKLPTDNISF